MELFKDVTNFVCQHLPDGWQLNIQLEKDAGSLELVDPDGECEDVYYDEGMLSGIVDAVNQARELEKLPEVAP